MTYNVFSGTLNPTQSQSQSVMRLWSYDVRRDRNNNMMMIIIII